MRISTTLQYGYYLSQIQSAQERYDTAQRQVMSGKKFTLASESPGEAQFVISANGLKARVQQLDNNLRNANDYLNNTQSAFDDLSTLVNRAYVLAVNGSNSTYDQSARDSMVSEIADIQKRMVSIANSQGANSQYLFAGQKTDVKPFTANPPNLTFNGDTNPVNVEVRPGELMQVNLQGADTFFTNLYGDLENLKNDLMSGDVSQVGSQDIQAMRSQLNQINAVSGDLGTKLQSVQSLTNQNTRRMDDLTKQVSDVQDVDMAAAITNMQAAQTAYSAALQVTAVGQGLSLMDYLK